MSSSCEQTIVISDLLSFVTCKMNILGKDTLLKCLRDFYLTKEIEETVETFLSSLSPKLRKCYQQKCKGSDSLIDLYNFVKQSPKEHLPIFVCKDLNNIPKPDSYDESSKEDGEQTNLVNEQNFLKSQISEISSVVYQLKDQIQLLTQNNRPSNKTKGSGLAYLQKLIDEEENKKVKKSSILKKDTADFYQSSIFDGDLRESIVEDEQTIHLKANRMQRALLNNAETKDKNSKRKRSISPFKDSLPPHSSCVKMRQLDGDEEEEEEMEGLLKEKVIHIGTDEEALDAESNPDDSAEFSTELNESEYSSEAEKSTGKIYLDTEGPCELQEASSKPLDGGTEGEKLSFIVVEQVFDENVGHFSVYKCSLCNFSTNDAKAVEQHNCPQIYSEDPTDANEPNASKAFRYFCLHCRFKCNGKLLFKKHTLNHPESFPCPFCPDKFHESEQWTDHVMGCINSSDRNPANNVCQVCGIVYAHTGALSVHKGFHDPTKPFECMKCRYRFYTQESLDKHFRSHLVKGFNCPFCHFVNRNKATLTTHIRCHTGQMPFFCEFCPYRCASQSALTAHLFCHTDKRDIKCDECSAVFKSASKLSSHKITHSNNRQHKCPVCDKSFKTGWLMTIHHQRLHLNIRPYACHRCDYKARSTSALKSHLGTHSNEKPFKCLECDFRANHKGYLNRHITLWHSKKTKVKEESGDK